MTSKLSDGQAKVMGLKHCTLCWEFNTKDKRKISPVFACIGFGQAGWYTPETVCRNCLMTIVNNEIENIRLKPADNYDGLDYLIPHEINVIKQIAFEGLE